MAELSTNKLKYLTSLHQKKTREEEGVFIAEGLKVITDLIRFGFVPQLIAYNPSRFDLKDFGQSHAFCEYFTTNEMQDGKMSLLSTPPGILAIFAKPVYEIDKTGLKSSYVFILDNINDPGNLGTIIRTAHWYGIENLYITKGSAEIFGPKVVQSSMGSLAAVKIHIIDNESFINDLNLAGIPIYLTDMQGEDISKSTLSKPFAIVFGNESNGISDIWRNAAKSSLTITPAQPGNHPESLNLSVSAAISMQLLTRH
jgi:TrmH family RNA methyltransferase